MNLQKMILANLLSDEEYTRKVIPFIKEEYFTTGGAKVVFNLIADHVANYNEQPTKDVLEVDLDKITVRQDEFEEAVKLITELSTYDEKPKSLDWLIDNTEKYCKEKAMLNAILESISIIDGKVKDKGHDSIPDIVQEALAVSFDTDIGHDYLVDAEKRFDFYHKKENKVPFAIDYMNRITKGGVSAKTLNVLMAGVGVGKSLTMCSFAADNLRDHKNVLYITMELSEEAVSERIDANLMDVDISEVRSLSRDVYKQKIRALEQKRTGKLIVKEYPTGSAHAGNFRHLLKELELKKKFKPDIIYIDYLNICASSRMKGAAMLNMYNYVKAIAEELRGLAVEFNVPVWSATQVNREGYTNSDFGMEHQSESFGLPATVDLMLALIVTEELADEKLMMAKQLKSRYDDPDKCRRFLIGVDKTRMRVNDVKDPTAGLMGHTRTPQTSDEEDEGPPKMRMFDEIK